MGGETIARDFEQGILGLSGFNEGNVKDIYRKGEYTYQKDAWSGQ